VVIVLSKFDTNGHAAAQRQPGPPEHIALDLPADPGALSLARLAVGVVAARADLGLEDVDDLRLAVEELCLSMWRRARHQPVTRLLLRYSWEPAGVEVSCSFVTEGALLRPVGDGAAPAALLPARAGGVPDDLSQQILEALVDDHGVVSDANGVRGWVRKRRRLAPR